eukprot:m.298648 g.298648  ORF g.298648 m.298648 type:complete len:329 (-) comp16409_c1_seq36:1804-2790(-)
MEDYKIHGRLGEGAHGVVLLAEDTRNIQLVALKKVAVKKPERGNLPLTIVREIQALRHANEHAHIVRLFDAFASSFSIVLVFEYLPSNLGEILEKHGPIPESLTKRYLMMLMGGLSHCHGLRIMHRDLKPSNLLVSETGIIKVADFGLARCFHKESEKPSSDDRNRLYSHQVATRWYRAPELLYGARCYDETVDIWAVGCIFAEMLNNSPLFPGDNDIDQMSCVFKLLGTPTSTTWPEANTLPDFHKISFDHIDPCLWSEKFPDIPCDARTLLAKMVQFRAVQRPSASSVLEDTYFLNDPPPTPDCDLPKPGKYAGTEPASKLENLPF